MQERRIRVETGVELAILESVGGSRGLLCVHGWPAAKEDYADHLDQFAAVGEGWHVVALDQRGHGRSDAPAGVDSYSLKTLAGDVLALADALGWTTFVLHGHSMGGMVAQVVALEAGDRLDGLILMDTSHGPVGGIDPDMVALGKAVVSEGGMPALVEAQRSIEGALDTPANQRVVDTRPGYVEFGESKTLAASPDMWLGMIDEIVTDQDDRLSDLAASPVLASVPVLLIYGVQDTPFVPHAERLAAALPHARLEWVADAGHSPQFEAPQAYARLVGGFLEEVPDAVRSLAGLAALFLVAAGVGGCGRFTSKKDAVPDPTVEVGGDTNLDRTRPTSGPTTTVLPSPTTPVADPLTTVPADAPGTGSVDIEVVDTEGTPRSGVAVQFDGPVRGTVVSGADGRLRFAIRAGRYQATALEGCRGQLVVERGGKADLGVAAGQTASGKLVVQVGLRFEPVAPVAYSGDAAWRVGEEHRVQLRLADVCETDGPPSPAAYVAARFASGDGVEVVAPLSGGVDPQGTVEIALRCTAPDQDVTLELADALNPRWTRPILTTALLTQQRPPFCVD